MTDYKFVKAIKNGTEYYSPFCYNGTGRLLTKVIQNNVEYMLPSIHVTSVSLNASSIVLSSAGQTSQLTATINPSNATNKKVTWSSSNTNIATVSSTGLVTCVTPGSCTITVTTEDGGYTASCSVIAYYNICYVIVGGGGGGGGAYKKWTYQGFGGGGGGGTYAIYGTHITNKSLCAIVGSGGSGGYDRANWAYDGGYSSFNGTTRGGGGAAETPRYCGNYQEGGHGGNGIGAGGGGSGDSRSGYCDQSCPGGCGCLGGGNGGALIYNSYDGGNSSNGGGGGGAGGNAYEYDCSRGGHGGPGYSYTVAGITECFGGGGGGGGGCGYSDGSTCCRLGGEATHGGGNGGDGTMDGCNAICCGGGGGGGGGRYGQNGRGGNGAGGVVIVWYKADGSDGITSATGGNCCVTRCGYKVHCFTSNGTFTITG